MIWICRQKKILRRLLAIIRLKCFNKMKSIIVQNLFLWLKHLKFCSIMMIWIKVFNHWKKVNIIKIKCKKCHSLQGPTKNRQRLNFKIKFKKSKKLLLISKPFSSLKILLQNLKFHSNKNKFKYKNRKIKK